MEKKLHFDPASEREATDIGAKFMHSSDVVGDMSRAYGRDLSSVRIHTDESAARGAAERGVDAFSTGKDVFFARGAFDRSDPASRGLLAHELSHSMQQGVGGGGGAMAQSAPMGAAQGGLREWFKGLFGKSGDAEDSAPEQDTDTSDMDAQLTQSNDPQKELDDAAEALRGSKKWGLFGNSDKFENVTAAINVSVGKLNATLSGELAQDHTILEEITDSFRKLIDACDDYITSHDPSTDRGKHRQAIVRQVRELAAKDLAGFAFYMSSPDQGERVTSPIDILKRSRQRTLQLVDKKEAELEHVGGAASYIAKIEPGMLTDANASGFFKEDETYTKFEYDDIFGKRLDALKTLRRRISLTDAQYKAIETVVMQNGELSKETAGYNEDRRIHEAVKLLSRLADANGSVYGGLPNPLAFGETLNLSKRNVATSRLAELLGVGDLVAKSETVTLVDADGTQRSGNLMQKAEGQAVASFFEEQFRDQYAAKRKDYSSSDGVKMEGNLDDKVTPEFLKSLMSLQVLDNLAGQTDRHSDNYFADVRDGKLGKVQGIDNDFSFTSNTLEWEENQPNKIGQHGKNILDRNGKLMVPYMDKALADNITALDESVLRDVMVDILEPWAIDALCVRFNKIKTAIQEDQNNDPASKRYLNGDEAWGSQEVFDTLRNGVEEFSINGNTYRSASNYVSNVLIATDMSAEKCVASQNLRGHLESGFKTRICEEVLENMQRMTNAEDVKASLKSYGVPNRVISYLETTGQLFDGPALLNRLPWNELGTFIYYKLETEWRKERTRKLQQKE